MLTFLALDIARAYMYSISVGLRRRSRNISVDLSLFVLLYNTDFMNKLKFNDFLKLKKLLNSLTVQIFFNLRNHPTFNSEKRLVNLKRGRECSVGLSMLLVYMPLPEPKSQSLTREKSERNTRMLSSFTSR